LDRINHLKYAQIESEQRFLLKDLPDDIDSGIFWRITDKYIPGTHLRLRTVAAPDETVQVRKFTQKYKQPGQPAHEATITNFYLDETEFAVLDTLPGLLLVKRRYRYLHGGQAYSLDAFESNLEGLVLAELESPDAGEAVVPAFAIRDVTADPAFSGGTLARLTRAEFLVWFATQQEQE
jgi:CYTH domain-containing protein